MTELDHLEEIAEANAFGFQGISSLHNASHKHLSETCGAGHPWRVETTRWYRYRGRRRRICRVCDKLRHKLKHSPSSAPGIAPAGDDNAA